VSKPIKVVSIITRMNTGGAARLIDSLSQGFHESKEIDHLLVIGEVASHEQDFLAGKNVNYRIKKIEGLGKQISILQDLKAFINLMKLLRLEKPNIVHTHLSKAGLLGRLAAKIAVPRAKIVHTIHGHLYVGYFSKAFVFLLITLEKLLTKFTDLLIFTGPSVMAELNKLGIKKSNQVVIEPGVKPMTFLSKIQARDKFNLDSEKVIIGFAGRLTRIKRVDRLLDVFEKIQQLHPDTQLIIAGGGDLESWVQEQILNRHLNIKLLGWQSDIAAVIAACDIWMLTSDNEATPLSVIEASLGGVVSVATNVGDVAHAIENQVSGLVVSTDVNSLLAAVDELVTAPEKRQKLASNAKIRAESHFLEEKMVQSHVKLYLAL
jgi:glycosyltransferase involved in cell wall biosynthesis